jgi:hypothetical protein
MVFRMAYFIACNCTFSADFTCPGHNILPSKKPLKGKNIRLFMPWFNMENISKNGESVKGEWEQKAKPMSNEQGEMSEVTYLGVELHN